MIEDLSVSVPNGLIAHLNPKQKNQQISAVGKQVLNVVLEELQR